MNDAAVEVAVQRAADFAAKANKSLPEADECAAAGPTRSCERAVGETVVGGHHERVAGTDYSNGLAGEAILVTARIFAIAGVFDAPPRQGAARL
jgi:hypothetical protein